MNDQTQERRPCPACGEPESTACAKAEAPADYRRCKRCGSIFSPRLLDTPLTTEEWSALPRPAPRRRDVARMLRPLCGFPSVALSGRADIEFMRGLRRRGLPVEACDMAKTPVDEAVKCSLPARIGLPSQGALQDRHDLVIVEGLLEYVQDPLAELAALKAALHRDGRVRIEAPSAESLLKKTLGAEFSLFARPGARTLYTVEGLTLLAARAGFPRVSLSLDRGRAADWLLPSQNISPLLRLSFHARNLFFRDASILVLTCRIL